METDRNIRAEAFIVLLNKRLRFLLLVGVFLTVYAGLNAQGVSNNPIAVDTNAFVDEFCDYAWDGISEAMEEPYNVIYASGVGFQGLTITMFELTGGTIQDVSFSKDMPDPFKKGIANALGDALLVLKGQHKPIVNGKYLLPLHITVANDQAMKRTAYKTVSDFVNDNKQYQGWYRLPLNRMRVDFN